MQRLARPWPCAARHWTAPPWGAQRRPSVSKLRDRPFQYLVRDWYTYGLESTQTSKLEGSKAPKYRNGPMSNGPMLLRHLTLGYLGRASVELASPRHLPFVADLREGTSTKGEEG